MQPEDGGALPATDFPAAGALHSGYRCLEVDEFVAELRRAVRSRPPTMAPYEVADVRFPVTRREDAYAMEPVDRFLDEAQSLLQRLHGADAVAAVAGHVAEERPDARRTVILAGVGMALLVLIGLLIVLL